MIFSKQSVLSLRFLFSHMARAIRPGYIVVVQSRSRFVLFG